MKILLDESLPVKLKMLPWNNHSVFSVRDMGWLGNKNGELLRLIIENGFEVFVTADQNLPYQQNLNDISFAIAILRGIDNRQETYVNLIPKLLLLLNNMPLPKVIKVK